MGSRARMNPSHAIGVMVSTGMLAGFTVDSELIGPLWISGAALS